MKIYILANCHNSLHTFLFKDKNEAIRKSEEFKCFVYEIEADLVNSENKKLNDIKNRAEHFQVLYKFHDDKDKPYKDFYLYCKEILGV